MSGFTVWFTGLPCSGKTTLANLLAEKLKGMGLKVESLDGDVTRKHLSKGLGFSKEDRDENIRRVGFVCGLLTRNGVAVTAAFVSPYRAIRDEIREEIGHFVEVYTKCPVGVCIGRDTKGLYQRALRGEISNFTGVSDPYEPPLHPEVICETDREAPGTSVAKILEKLQELGYVAPWRRRLIGPHGGRLVNRVLNEGEKEQTLGRSEHLRHIPVGLDTLLDAEKIAIGAFSPLEGFMTEEELGSVAQTMRLPDGTVWPLPVFLPMSRGIALKVEVGEEVVLADSEGRAIALMEISGSYELDREAIARSVFGTVDSAHPGVRRLYESGNWAVSGKVSLLNRPERPFRGLELDPKDTRRIFIQRGWRKVVGFQTRNAPHRAHEYVQRVALEIGDGLFIHPIFGDKKVGDFSNDSIVRGYLALMENYYPKDRVLFSGLSTAMRYAGPKEAVFHALVRKNYGCSHFLVGRDHAGVGNYYDPYAAHWIFDQIDDIGVEIIKLQNLFYCKRCDSMASDKSCGHQPKDRVYIGMTKVRELLGKGEYPPMEMIRPEVAEVLLEERREERVLSGQEEEHARERLKALGYIE